MAEDRVETEEDSYGLSSGLFEAVSDAIAREDAEELARILGTLHPADVADLLEQIESRDRRALLALWKGGVNGEILSELNDSVRREVIEILAPAELAEAVRELESDDLVDLVEYLSEAQQETVLAALQAPERIAIERALAYPDESAGRLMQVEVVRAPLHWTVGEAVDYLRTHSEELPEQFYHVILVNPRMKPVGYVTLGRLLSSRRQVRLRDITEDTFRTIAVDQDEGEVAYVFNQYHLISAPVVDENERLVGVITIDDAMRVLDAEHEEDLLRLAGLNEGESVSDSSFSSARRRLPWLIINLFTASLSAVVIAQFEDTISALVVLAALMPIVASTGGIAGTQSLAVAARALATRDLTSANARRVVMRELGAGLLNGIGLSLVLGMGGWLIFGDPKLGAVLGSAMIVNQVVAALGGILVPLTLNRFGLDPALASGTFVTTLTDVMGFFAFLGFATLFLV